MQQSCYWLMWVLSSELPHSFDCCTAEVRPSTSVHIIIIIIIIVIVVIDRLCGLVVRVSGYRYRGLGFDFRRYQIF